MDQKCIRFLDNNVMMRCGGRFFCVTGTVRQLDAGMSEPGGWGGWGSTRSSSSPYLNRGEADYAHQIKPPPQIFRPSDIPDLMHVKH